MDRKEVSYNIAFTKTMRHEGEYVNDPDDAGGETYRGISRKFHPGWQGWSLIDGCKREPGFPGNLRNHYILNSWVETFYKINYWFPVKADRIPSQVIAELLFDIAVNSGKKKATLFCQMALNVLNRDEKDYPDIKEDGTFGDQTLKTITTHLEKNGERLLFNTINIIRGFYYYTRMNGINWNEFYETLTKLNRGKSNEKFRGWIYRIEVLSK